MGTRFLKYLAAKGVSQRAFCTRSGLSPSLLSRFCAGGAVSSDNLERIVSCCPDLSLDWLLRGEGPMERAKGQGSDVVTDKSVLVKNASGVMVSAGQATEELLSALLEKDRMLQECIRTVTERDRTITRLNLLVRGDH